MKPWHFRRARAIVYAAAAVAAIGVALAGGWGASGWGDALVAARQLYGLWALGLLLASLIVGPLTAVLPWPPARGPLMYARRAVGVCALLFAALHVGCYLASVGLRDWRELYTPGALWVIGLVLGTLALADMAALGATSFDAAVRRMGGRSWKRLHRTVYLLLAVVFAHALATGADFGLNRGPDVTSPPDAGAGIAFACVAAAWLALFLLRRRGVRWARLLPRPTVRTP